MTSSDKSAPPPVRRRSGKSTPADPDRTSQISRNQNAADSPADSPARSPANSSTDPSPDSPADSALAASALAPAQRLALEQITSGRSLTQAAAAARINRTTLYRWLHSDANFQAAYNAWQQDALLNARTKLLTMADAAVNTVGHALNHDPRLAFSFLKTLGALDRPAPGPTDPREVEQRMNLDHQKSEAQLEDELLFVSIPTGLRRTPTFDRSNES